MVKKLLSLIKYVLIFGLTGFLLWDSFQKIDESALAEGQSKFGFILDVFSQGSTLFFILSAFFTILSHFIRSERWKLLLEPIGYKVSSWNSFTAVINGYFVNLAIPRGGEVSRPITLGKLEGVPLNTSLGTVVMERIIDLIFLVICLGSVFIFQFSTLLKFLQEHTPEAAESQNSNSLGIFHYAIIAILMTLIVVFALYKLKPILFEVIKQKAIEFIVGMKSGVLSVFKLEKRFLFLFYSVAIWVCYMLMLWMILLAFPETENLSFMNALTIFAVGGIALAIPSPGGAGTYHTMVPLAMVHLCGMTDLSKGVAFATIFHGWQTLIVIILGMVGLIVINAKKKTHVEPIKN